MEKNILVVEDDSGIREMIEYLLGMQGLYVRGVGTAQKFWESIGQELPDLIILDIMLPDGNGIEICRRLKADSGTSHIPVVLMSANMVRNEMEFQTLAQDYISKPFDVDDFLTRVHRQIA